MDFLKNLFSQKGSKRVSTIERIEIFDLVEKLSQLYTYSSSLPGLLDEGYEHKVVSKSDIEDAKLRVEVTEKLVNFGAAAVEPLISLLGNLHHRKAADILIRIGEPAVKPLTNLLNDFTKNQKDNGLIINALDKIGDSRATTALIYATNRSKYFNHRADAARALGKVAKSGNNAKAVKVLFSALTDESYSTAELQKAAAEALGMIGTSSIEASLLKILNDHIKKNGYFLKTSWLGSQNSIVYVITALGIMKSTQSVDVLIRLLQKYPRDKYVISALGDIGDARAVEPLIEAYKQSDGDYMRMFIKKELEKLGYKI